MFSLEYMESTGRSSEHQYHKDIVDLYLIHKDNKRVFSEKYEWTDYCLLLEVDNLNKELAIKKTFTFTRSGRYGCNTSDYWTIRDELEAFLNEVKEMLDILDYKIRK